jgi:hypothetical protein
MLTCDVRTENALLCAEADTNRVSAKLPHVFKFKTEAGCSFKSVVPSYKTTQRHNPKEHNMSPHFLH